MTEPRDADMAALDAYDIDDDYDDCDCTCHRCAVSPGPWAPEPVKPKRLSRRDWKKRALSAEADAIDARAEPKEPGVVSIVFIRKDGITVLAGLNVTRNGTARYDLPTPIDGVSRIEAFMS